VLHGFAAAVDSGDLDKLRADPDVDHVEPDRIVKQMGTETGMGWALDRLDQHGLPLNNSFSYGATGSGVNIYIVDGGIRYTHAEFGGRAHFAFDALGGNGSDCNGHGTGVAGVAAGSKYGVAKSATIWSVRVFPCSGSTPLSTILAGVDWVTAHHKSPAIANLSLGANIAPILDSAVSKSIQAGVTYVVAAGNSGADACTMSPAKVKTAITVGAIDVTDSRPSWSNYGSCVAMFAPGVNVPAADYYSDASYANWNGTSMAAPFVTGAAALYLSEHPSASPATVRSALTSNTTTSLLGNLLGSTNKLLYISWIGGTSTPAAPAPSSPSAPPSIAPVGGVGASYSCASRVCRFDAAGSAPTGGVTSYVWTFGDGVTGTGRTWTHSYGTATSYTFRLDIVTGTGKKYSAGKSITPASASGSATSTVPTYVPSTGSGTITPTFTVTCSGTRCAFNARSSSASKGISSYKWAFGDGYTGSTVAWTHTYSGKKTVSVTLTVTDKAAGSKSVTKSVAVP
ncbi:MAG: S8 family serine peptidase, partial [Gemmatimonadaceae bacterium]